jgi:hypothetical protein
MKLTFRVLVLLTLLAAVAACTSWSLRLTEIGVQYDTELIPGQSSEEESPAG